MPTPWAPDSQWIRGAMAFVGDPSDTLRVHAFSPMSGKVIWLIT